VRWSVKRWPLLRVEVAEHSMLPALHDGDWLLAVRTRRIRPGQIVLALHPQRPGLQLVKRATRRVDGGWWLESDFPAAPGAVDSAAFGPVPEEKIIARVLLRYHRPRRDRYRSRLSRTNAADCVESRSPAGVRDPTLGSCRSGSVIQGQTSSIPPGGTSSMPDCALTRASIFSEDSFVYIAQ
jgi:nickel-type superoxide dismutase maturation protease